MEGRYRMDFLTKWILFIDDSNTSTEKFIHPMDFLVLFQVCTGCRGAVTYNTLKEMFICRRIFMCRFRCALCVGEQSHTTHCRESLFVWWAFYLASDDHWVVWSSDILHNSEESGDTAVRLAGHKWITVGTPVVIFYSLSAISFLGGSKHEFFNLSPILRRYNTTLPLQLNSHTTGSSNLLIQGRLIWNQAALGLGF